METQAKPLVSASISVIPSAAADCSSLSMHLAVGAHGLVLWGGSGWAPLLLLLPREYFFLELSCILDLIPHPQMH